MRVIKPGAVLALLCLPLIFGASPADTKTEKEKDTKQAKTYEIPYKFTKASHIVVRAKINGKGPFNLVLDTGAPALFLAVEAGKKANAKAGKDGWAKFDKFELEGGLVIESARGRIETPFQLEGMNGLGLAGMEIHGLMGYDLLAKYRMTFDFSKHKLEFTELNYKPEVPFRLSKEKGGQGIGGLEAMGKVMKMIGGFLGKKPAPEVKLRGFCGMTLTDGEENPVVEAVLEKGPAGEAGLKKGDVILKVNDRAVDDTADVVRLAAKVASGDKLTLSVKRGDETRKITITVGEGI